MEAPSPASVVVLDSPDFNMEASGPAPVVVPDSPDFNMPASSPAPVVVLDSPDACPTRNVDPQRGVDDPAEGDHAEVPRNRRHTCAVRRAGDAVFF